MDALQLLTWSLILYLFASLASLFLLGLDRLAIKLSGITSLVGGVIGIISGITQLHAGVTLVAHFATPFDFADLTLRMDSLSAFMVLVISLLVVVCSLYSLTYMREYEGKGAAAMGFFMNLFIASMVALLVMDNAFWFIVLFEMMSLSSWFLVIARQDKTSINAGMLYFFIAHAGSVLIMIAFLLMGRESGSLDFASFARFHFLRGWRRRVSAGLFRFWRESRDDAVAQLVAARSPCRTIARFGVDVWRNGQNRYFRHPESSDGSAGANGFASVVGHSGDGDRRNLRAPGRAVCTGGTGYQTAAGLEYRRKRRHYFAGGRCGDGRSVTARPAAHRGWTARRTVSSAQPCAVQRAAISRRGCDYFAFAYPRHGKMGALAKRMPWTAAACLIGCLAISAIPPLNGFISEWYTWQSLFSLSRVEAVALQLAGPIAMVMLAVTGGLAVMCFVKMYGITFCGAPRSTHAEEAQEVPNTMIVAMLLLAALCVLIALSASWLAPKIMHIAHAFTNTPPVTVASGIALVPGTFHTRVTPSLLLLLLLAMPLLPGLYWLWCRSRRAAFRRTGDAWACGYGWENAMAPSGNGVMQPLRVVFSALFRLRQQFDPTLRLNKGLAHVTARAQSTEPFWDERVIRPIVSATQRLAKEIQHLQSGDFRLYCLYVVAALVVLLIAIAV